MNDAMTEKQVKSLFTKETGRDDTHRMAFARFDHAEHGTGWHVGIDGDWYFLGDTEEDIEMNIEYAHNQGKAFPST